MLLLQAVWDLELSLTQEHNKTKKYDNHSVAIFFIICHFDCRPQRLALEKSQHLKEDGISPLPVKEVMVEMTFYNNSMSFRHLLRSMTLEKSLPYCHFTFFEFCVTISRKRR